MNKKELEKAIEEKKKEIGEKVKELDNFELDPENYRDEFDEILDSEGDIIIGSLHYSPSAVLKTIDPTAYNCGLLDYVNSIPKENTKEYLSLEVELAELEYELEELEEELADLEDELDELEEE